MADILIPGGGTQSSNPAPGQNIDPDKFLKKEYYLGEFDTEPKKEIARNNLGVPKKGEAYTKAESDAQTEVIANSKIISHLAASDPHSILSQVDAKITEFVKKDGTTPFTASQLGVDPIVDLHLVTKRFVTKLLQDHLNVSDPHNSIALISHALIGYVQASQVFTKAETYNRNQIDNLFSNYVKKDGTTPFLFQQKGVQPTSDFDLTTKKYVDDLIYGYIQSSDLNNFKLFVNNALNLKANTANVYTKTESYSKAQVDHIITIAVRDAVQDAIDDYAKTNFNVSVSDLNTKLAEYTKTSDLQANYATIAMLTTLCDECLSEYSYYVPSGPINSPDVGFIKTGDDIPNPTRYQDLFDMIFYGTGIKIEVDKEYVEKGGKDEVCITMTAKGAQNIDTVDLYFNGILYNSYDYASNFVNGVFTICGIIINQNTEICMTANYYDVCDPDLIIDNKTECTTIWAVAPMYIGMLPKWLFGSNLTYDLLEKLVNGDLIDAYNYDIPIWGDPKNNWKFIRPLVSGDSIIVHYDFAYDGIARHPFIAYPKYDNITGTLNPKMYEMSTPSQQFSTVDNLTDIPIQLLDGSTEIYVIFIYSPAVTSLTTDVTFKFM